MIGAVLIKYFNNQNTRHWEPYDPEDMANQDHHNNSPDSIYNEENESMISEANDQSSALYVIITL